MNLFDKRTISKVKNLALKNKDKIADGVTKATGTIDKKTGGKYADHLKKVDEAATKFGGTAPAPGSATTTSDATPTDATPTDVTSDAGSDDTA